MLIFTFLLNPFYSIYSTLVCLSAACKRDMLRGRLESIGVTHQTCLYWSIPLEKPTRASSTRFGGKGVSSSLKCSFHLRLQIPKKVHVRGVG